MNDAHDTGRRLLRWYPPPWRERYGEELVALMADETDGGAPPWSMRFEVARGGIRERARQSGLTGHSRPAAERVRSGALLVLCGWMVLVLGGAMFQKLSEHFQQAVPPRARALPEGAFDAVVAAATVGALVVLVGAVCAGPAFVRFLRAGGWASLRRRVWAAVASSALCAVAITALAGWARSLTEVQRNGGSTPYLGTFLGVALLLAVTLGLWTAVAVACARRVEFSARLLRVEGGLAIVLFVLMSVLVIAAAVWWGSMGSAAPWFLHGSRPGSSANAFAPNVITAVGVMVVAVAISSYGVGRMVRDWATIQPG